MSATMPTDTPEPFSAHFLDTNARLAAVRRNYIKAFVPGAAIVLVVILGFFSIYWGSLWRSPTRPLPGCIVDFDGGVVGQAIIQGLNNKSNKIAWTLIPASNFPDGPSQVAQALIDEDCWTAVSINPEASALLASSLAVPTASYNGSLAVTGYGIEARNENAYRSIIHPTLLIELDEITKSFAIQFAQGLSSLPPSNMTTLLTTSPQLVVSPISYTFNNVIPFDAPVAAAITNVGLIYLLVCSFFVVMAAYGAREASGLSKILTLRSLIYVRLISIFSATFFLSLSYSLLNVAFHLPLERKYGRAGFIIFWMLTWAAMTAVGLALEALLPLLTTRFISIFMAFWIVVNASVCALPLEILPKVYYYGYAVPFYNVGNAVRSIVFGTRNNVGQNFGIILSWVAISCISLSLIQWNVRRKDIAVYNAAQRKVQSPTESETTATEGGQRDKESV